MTEIMTWITGFGLAGGAGGKAFVPLLALGAFHYTPYFELSERFDWIASPQVMIVMGVLLIIEVLVDSVPELAEYADLAAYLPKAAAGFLAFAATTGTIDDDLGSLVASGLLGAGTATAGHWLRNQIRRPFRQTAESVHAGAARLASLGEVGASGALAGSAIVAPPLGLLVLFAVVGLGVAVLRIADGRRRGCPSCGGALQPQAIVCPHCGWEDR
jgi:hypothetical protein